MLFRSFKLQVNYLEEYAAKLMDIDIETFRKEVNAYRKAADEIGNASSDEELKLVLYRILKENNLYISWESYDSFDDAMQDPDFVLSIQ